MDYAECPRKTLHPLQGKIWMKSMQYWKEKFRCYYKVITVNKIRRRKVTVQTIVKTDEILKNIFVDKLKQDGKSC